MKPREMAWDESRTSDCLGRLSDWWSSYRTPGKRFIDSPPGLLVIVILSVSLTYSFLLLADQSWYHPTEVSVQPGYTLGKPSDTGLKEPFQHALGLLVVTGLTVCVSSKVSRRLFPRLKKGAWNFGFAILLGVIYVTIFLFGINEPTFEGIQYCGTASSLHVCDNQMTDVFDTPSLPFWLMFITQMVIFMFTTWVYTHPVVPGSLKYLNLERTQEYSNAHMANWWRYTQSVLSLAAIAVAGLVIPLLIDKLGFGRGRLLPIAILFIVPLGAILLFSVAKLHLVGERAVP